MNLGHQLKQKIFRQITKEDAQVIGELEQVISSLLTGSLFMTLLLIGFGGRLLPTWMMLNTLHLMVHLPLLPVYLPSNMSFLLSEYLRTMQLRSNELEQY